MVSVPSLILSSVRAARPELQGTDGVGGKGMQEAYVPVPRECGGGGG